ncbi:MAG: hypothetical protein II376_00745, partial [Clostridia bacterium]|nr:hypothetical protein [Clostridia bacterium]
NTIMIYSLETSSVHFQEMVPLSAEMTVLSAATYIVSACSLVPAALVAVAKGVSIVMNVAYSSESVLGRDANLDTYLLTYRDHHYANVNGNGPYAEAIKLVEYIGMEITNDPSDPIVSEPMIMYTPDDEDYFEDTTYQEMIQDAYENYIS